MVAEFLSAVGSHAGLRFAMRRAGYGPADHAEGLRLLAAACEYVEGGIDPADDEPAREAGVAIESWSRRHVPRLRAALERLHPDEVAVFSGFELGAALIGLTSLLQRLDALERGEASERCLALESLARRGLDRRERARLRRLLELAKRAGTPPRSLERPWRDPEAGGTARVVSLVRRLDDDRACVRDPQRLVDANGPAPAPASTSHRAVDRALRFTPASARGRSEPLLQ